MHDPPSLRALTRKLNNLCLRRALSVIETSPDVDPAVCGEKVTLIEQFAPGATCAWQVVELKLN
jgi:hypothetical protein